MKMQQYNKRFVNLVENSINSIKEEAQGENNIEGLFKYITSMTMFNLKDGIADLIARKVSVSSMTQYAKSQGFYENGDVPDARLAEFNDGYREHVNLPLIFGDVIDDEAEAEDAANDVPAQDGGEEDLGLGGEEGGEEELKDDVDTGPANVLMANDIDPTDNDEMIVPETVPESEETDLEGRFAKQQLLKTCEYSNDMMAMIEDDEQLPAWVQAKLTKVADYIGAVKHYLEAEKDLKK